MTITQPSIWLATFSVTALLGAVSASAGQEQRTIVDRVYSIAQAERGEARFKVS